MGRHLEKTSTTDSPLKMKGTITSKINYTPKGIRLSKKKKKKKKKKNAALSNEIWPQQQIRLMLFWGSKFATAKIGCNFKMCK